jgi:hypothetical protein
VFEPAVDGLGRIGSIEVGQRQGEIGQVTEGKPATRDGFPRIPTLRHP